jgi:hypothetical protein
MLFLLLNLALIWCLVTVYFTVRSDQLVALMQSMNDLDEEMMSLSQRLERYARQGRHDELELAELKRQNRRLKFKIYALLLALSFINAPFAVARFLLAPFRKKE